MDPYLEDPGLWSDAHHEIISVVRGILSARLRPNYYVRVEERIYISDKLETDLIVRVPDDQVSVRPGKRGGTMVLDRPRPPRSAWPSRCSPPWDLTRKSAKPT